MMYNTSPEDYLNLYNMERSVQFSHKKETPFKGKTCKQQKRFRLSLPFSYELKIEFFKKENKPSYLLSAFSG